MADIHTAAWAEPPAPEDPTATVVPLYRTAAPTWLGPEAGNAATDQLVVSADVQADAVGDPDAFSRLPRTSHGPPPTGVITEDRVEDGPPPSARGAELERIQEYGEGANCWGASVVVVAAGAVVEVETAGGRR